MTDNNYSEFKAGVYRHYKGPLYLVLGLGHDANEEGRTTVIYIGLELDGAKKGPRLSVRTYEDFYSYVDPTTRDTVDRKDPNALPRFEYIGQTADERQA
jgi:hypothetical protein